METMMTFKEAYEHLANGEPIKRVNWLGYWILEDGDVKMHRKDGGVVCMSTGCFPLYTLQQTCEDDWYVVPEKKRMELDKIHASKCLARKPE